MDYEELFELLRNEKRSFELTHIEFDLKELLNPDIINIDQKKNYIKMAREVISRRITKISELALNAHIVTIDPTEEMIEREADLYHYICQGLKDYNKNLGDENVKKN